MIYNLINSNKKINKEIKEKIALSIREDDPKNDLIEILTNIDFCFTKLNTQVIENSLGKYYLNYPNDKDIFKVINKLKQYITYIYIKNIDNNDKENLKLLSILQNKMIGFKLKIFNNVEEFIKYFSVYAK